MAEVVTPVMRTEQKIMMMQENYDDDGSSSLVRLETILPRTVLRVLLVEADDSTRQIIAALLRKCCYEVAAVPDGLKAWEVLEGRPKNIDLVLMEVELPSISGYALLSLIMEHEIYKSIPVIMMSSQDSVSTVYKCMLRGAVDFLIKPVRKNELRNLWQHTWRRQEMASQGQFLEFFEKKWCKSLPSEALTPSVEECSVSSEEMEKQVKGGSPEEFLSTITLGEAISPGNRWNCADITTLASDCDNVVNSSREAIDLIGAFDKYLKCTYRSSSSNYGTKKENSSPLLDLSSRRISHLSSSVNPFIDDRSKLNHSEASAFSRYKNRTIPPQHSTTLSHDSKQLTAYEIGSSENEYNSALAYNFQTTVSKRSFQRKIISVVTCQPEQAKSGSQPEESPFQIQAANIRFENQFIPYNSASAQEPTFQVESWLSPDSETRNLRKHHNCLDESLNNSHEQADNDQCNELEDQEEQQGHVSFTTDDSTGCSLYDGSTSHHNSFCCTSKKIRNLAPVETASTECMTQEGRFSRSRQREAVLTKFRLKRKDRCFDKKVRYESRKKLAEQRPRVKGQFVRQLQPSSN